MACPAWAESRLDGADLKLSWSAPAECPSKEEVRSATLDNASARAKKQDAAPLEAEALVERVRDSAAWRVRLHTKQGSTIGERDIQASTCRGVADATAVVLALALVPMERDEPTASAAPPQIEDTEPKARDSGPREARASGPASASEPRIALGAGVAMDASTLPAATFGGGASLALTLWRLRLEVEGQRFASRSKSVAQSNAGASFTMTTLGGRACLSLIKSPRADLSPCVGANAVFLNASGFGADANYNKDATLATVTGGALGRLHLTSWFALRASLNAFVPLSRPTFIVENEGSVHQPKALGATAAVGVEVNFL